MELAVLHGDASGYRAAVARSLDSAITRLNESRKLGQRSASMFGGNVIDMTGDNMLLAFDSERAAYSAARHILETISFEKEAGSRTAPFDFRFGLAKGHVKRVGTSYYGESINLAARIESLVAKGNIGVERRLWRSVQSLATGRAAQERAMFVKPDEPLADFVEVIHAQQGAADSGFVQSIRNEPQIAIRPKYRSPSERGKNAAIESLIYSFSAVCASREWQSQIAVLSADDHQADQMVGSDYQVAIMAVDVPLGFRLFARLVSPHFKQAEQLFSRDVFDEKDLPAHVASLSSLLASAITHTEIERVHVGRHVGAHQLVTAGRELVARLSNEGFGQGFKLLKAAMEIDPEYPFLLATMGRAHAFAWRFGWNPDRIDLMENAAKFTNQAVLLSGDNWRCVADLAFVKFWANQPLEAEWHYERAMEALSYHPELAADAGMVFSYVGNNEKAERILEHSIANMPNDADYRLWSLGDVCFSKRDYANSLKWISRMRDQSQAQRLFAANKARLGLDPTQHVKNVLAQQPDFSVSRWVAIQPLTNEAEREDYMEALLAAGLPK